jgi:hypothetical protein
VTPVFSGCSSLYSRGLRYPTAQEILVVTSDNTLINHINAAGASAYPAESFRNLIDPA